MCLLKAASFVAALASSSLLFDSLVWLSICVVRTISRANKMIIRNERTCEKAKMLDEEKNVDGK